MLHNRWFVYYKGGADSKELNISKDGKFKTENREVISNTSTISNTNLCFWKDWPYLIYQQPEYHLSNDPDIECTWSIVCFLPTKIMILKSRINDLITSALFNPYNKNNLRTVNNDL